MYVYTTYITRKHTRMMKRNGEKKEGQKKESEKEKSAAMGISICDTRVLLLHDPTVLSLVIRELFCQSVRSLSAVAVADEPTSRLAIRTFALPARLFERLISIAFFLAWRGLFTIHNDTHTHTQGCNVIYTYIHDRASVRPHGTLAAFSAWCANPRGRTQVVLFFFFFFFKGN